MKRLFFIAVIFVQASVIFGQSLDNAAIHRIGDYGKLWSVLNLFHPAMAYNTINADSLFTDNIDDLLKDPSAENFKSAMQNMIGKLGDPYTTIVKDENVADDSVQLSERPLLKWLPGNIALIHFDENFMSVNNNGFGDNKASQQLKDTLKNATGIIIDLRKKTNNDENSDYYESKFMKRLVGFLTDRDISYPSYRSRIHYGHQSETFDMSSFYYQGWVTNNSSAVNRLPNAIHKPVCLLINKYNKNLSDAIAALQQEKIAKVLADDSIGTFAATSAYQMQLADSLTVNIGIVETIYPNGCKTFSPDTTVYSHGNNNEDSILNNAVDLLKSWNRGQALCSRSLQNIFVDTKVEGYDSLAYPTAPLRLLGLMRYWSAINYFCANKDRITKSWDSVLYEYVPIILQSKDSVEYMLAVARLITEIHDGHGWLDSRIWRNTYKSIPEVQLSYVNNKTIVYKTFNDSLKNILSPGDEIVKVDDVDIDKLRKRLSQYIGASNNAALQRDVTLHVLAGPDSSFVKITFLHNGATKDLRLKRKVGKYAYNSYTSGLPKQARNWTKLKDDIGYVDFGKLEVSEIDSMFNDFKNTKAIIIDNRSYPKGTVWTMVNYLTDKTVTTAKGTTMIADSPDPTTQIVQSSLWQIPVVAKFKYKGKIIILVNEQTQSQAEYSCMVIQAAFKNTTIIGSQTAGADGDVTGISIPGGIKTAFSGHGVYYPDGRPTQGIGIVPDLKISPTIKGIKVGKDEVLERAIQFAVTGK